MSKSENEKIVYVPGGPVQATSGGLYISRQADQKLLELCRTATFTYILTPRQMGKSSLMWSTRSKLNDEGIQTVVIDFQSLGVQVQVEEWYLGLLSIIEEQLMLDTDVIEWWEKNKHLGIPQRLGQFLQTILLEEISAPIVIFVDEIDTTLSLNFTDDFYTTIRYLYNSRADNPELKRLSFVLIGVASPSDLIQDKDRTPFNIGQRLDLTDFTVQEAMPLVYGLNVSDNQYEQILGWVMEWTNGHPYLTQRIFGELARKNQTEWIRDEISATVAETFLGEKSRADNNLQFVRDMLTHSDRVNDTEAILTTYHQVLEGKTPVLDDEQSLVISHLKLSGVVCNKNGKLEVRNEIYRQVFNEEWINSHIPINWKRRLTKFAAAAGLIFLLGLIPVSIFAIYQASQARKESVNAKKNEKIAMEAKNLAEENAAEAKRQSELAKNNEENAMQQKQIAEQKTKQAETSRQEAERQRTLAVNAKKEVEQQAEIIKKKNNELAQLNEKERKINEKLQQTVIDKTKAQKDLADALSKQEDLTRIADAAAESESELKAGAIRLQKEAEKYRDLAQARFYGAKSEQYVNTEFSTLGGLMAVKALDIFQRNNKYPVELNANQALSKNIFPLSKRINNQPTSIISKSLDNVDMFVTPIDGTILVTGKNNVLSGFDIDNPELTKDLRIIYPSKIEKILLLEQERKFLTLNSDGKLYILSSPDQPLVLYKQPIVLDAKNTNLWSNGPEFREGITDIIVGSRIENVDLKRGDVAEQLIAVASGNEIHILKYQESRFIEKFALSNNEKVLSLQFSKDGNYLAACDGDEARIWDMSNGSELAHTEGDDGGVVSAIFSPNGLYLATASKDLKVREWSISDGKQIIKPSQIINPLNYTPGFKKTPLKADNLSYPTFKSVKFTGETDNLQSNSNGSAIMKFSPDSKLLAVVHDQDVILTRPSPDNVVNSFSAKSGITHVDFTPDGRNLVAATTNGETSFWDITSGELTISLNNKKGDNQILFNHNGQKILVINNNSIQGWDLSEKTDAMSPIDIEQSISASAYNKAKGLLAVAGPLTEEINGKQTTRKKNITILKINNSKARFAPQLLASNISFSNDGRFFFSSLGGLFHLTSLESDQTIMLPSFKNVRGSDRSINASISYTALNSNGSLIAAVNNFSSIEFFETENLFVSKELKKTTQIELQKGYFDKILFSPLDKDEIAAVTDDSKVQIWKIVQNSPVLISVFVPDTQSARISNISYSPNGKLLAVSYDNKVTVLNLEKGISYPPFAVDQGIVNSLAWSDDNNYLAVSNRLEASIWELKELFSEDEPFKKQAKEFIRLAHNPDPNSYATIKDLFFLSDSSEDDKYLVTVGDDGFVRKQLWKPDDLIKNSCEKISNSFTADERNKLEEDWKRLMGKDQENPFPAVCFNK